jgi:hypothetical protein
MLCWFLKMMTSPCLNQAVKERQTTLVSQVKIASPDQLANLREPSPFPPLLRDFLAVRGFRANAEAESRYRRDFIDCCEERGFVYLRRFIKAADFSHGLERSGSNLLSRDRGIEVEEGFNIPAHW